MTEAALTGAAKWRQSRPHLAVRQATELAWNAG